MGEKHSRAVRHLGERLARLDLGAVVDEVADELAGDVGAQLGRVVDRRQEDGDAVEHHAQAERLLLRVHLVDG